MPPTTEDNYNDDPASTADSGGDVEGSGDSESKTSILPRSFFETDPKPGDKFSGTVVAVHENDVEVQPSDEEPDEDDSMPEPGPADDEAGAAQPTPDENYQ